MKKTLLIASAFAFMTSAFAQVNEPVVEAPERRGNEKIELKNEELAIPAKYQNNSNRTEEIAWEWVNFQEVTDELGGGNYGFLANIWPDSLAKIEYSNGLYPADYGYGQNIDLNLNSIFEYYEVAGEIHPGKGRKHWLGAFTIPYSYQRPTGYSDATIDTLKVYVRKGNGQQFTSTNDDSRWPYIPVASNGLEPDFYTDSMTILLDTGDVSEYGYYVNRMVVLDDSISIGPEEDLSIIFNFHPAIQAVNGDTIGGSKLPTFSTIMYEEDESSPAISLDEDPGTKMQGIMLENYGRYNEGMFDAYKGLYMTSFLMYVDQGRSEHCQMQFLVAPIGNGFVTSEQGKEVSFIAKDNFDADEWFWDFGDGNYGSNETTTHTYSTIGVYDVCLTSTKDNEDFEYCEKITVTNAVGMEEEFTNFEIYPNPATDNLVINLAGMENGVQVSIINMLGQEMYNSFSNAATFNENIDVSAYAAGVYTVKVAVNGKVSESKVVIE